MASWIALNTVKLTIGGQTALVREGDLVDDTNVDLAKLRDAGVQLIPSTDANAATMQGFAQTQALRGNRDDARRDQPTWGAYVRKASVTVSGTCVVGTMDFGNYPEPDSNYFVSALCTSQGGSANTQSAIVLSVSKQNTLCSFIVMTAPGSGQTATFDVIITR